MRSVASALLLLLAACGGAGPAPSAAVAPFIGIWGIDLTTTVTCGSDAPLSGTQRVPLQLGTSTGTDVTYLADSGCQFRFQVTGSTATLSNGPVSCTSNVGAVATTLTVQSYTLMTADGHNLTASSAGTVAASGTTCTFTSTGSATK